MVSSEAMGFIVCATGFTHLFDSVKRFRNLSNLTCGDVDSVSSCSGSESLLSGTAATLHGMVIFPLVWYCFGG